MTPTGTEFVMPFGKHKGTLLSEIDSGYLHWLTDKIEEWHPPLRAAIEAERARRKGLTPPSMAATTRLGAAPAMVSTPRRPAPSAPSSEARPVCALCQLPGTASPTPARARGDSRFNGTTRRRFRMPTMLTT